MSTDQGSSASSPTPGVPGRIASPCRLCRSDRHLEVAAGLNHLAPLPAALAAQRPGRGAGADRRAGAGGHGVRRGSRSARHLRAVRHHRAAHRLRHLRSQPHPGAGTGFVPGGNHCRGHLAPGGRRYKPCGSPGWHAGNLYRLAVHRCRDRPPWFYHRAALQAHPVRLYERHRPDRAGRAASQAVRFLCQMGMA